MPFLFLGPIGLFLYWFFFRENTFIISGLYLDQYVIDRSNPTEIVKLRGRKSGIVGWVFSMLGASNDYDIRISTRDIMIKSAGLFSEGQIYLPMNQIITARYSYTRPKSGFFATLFFGFYGFALIPGIGVESATSWPGAIFCFILAGLIFWFFYLGQRGIEVSFSTGDGKFWGYAYVIGADGDRKKAMETTLIISELIERVNRQVEDGMIVTKSKSDESEPFNSEV